MSQSGSFNHGGGPVPPTVVETLTADTGGPVGPTANNINIFGGENINTAGNPGTSTIVVNLNETIHWAETNNAGTTGAIYLGATGGVGGTLFMHNFGVATTTFLGLDAGNLTNSGTENTGIGSGVLNELTSGEANTGCGSSTLASLNGGFNNSAFGTSSLLNLTGGTILASSYNTGLGCLAGFNLATGSFNTLIGSGDGTTVLAAGQNYTGSESSNIIINNAGVVGENNTIRIGTNGSGNGQQDSCFIAGIYGESVGGTNSFVIIDNTGKLGTSGASPGADSFDTDSGTATPTAGVIDIAGGSNINTSGATNVVTINLDDTIQWPGTNAGGTTGVIYLDSIRFMHNYSDGGTASLNTFLGNSSGNFTSTGSAGNTGIGAATLFSLTTGVVNTAIGDSSLVSLTSGSRNNAIGAGGYSSLTSGIFNSSLGQSAMPQLVSGSYNLALGFTTAATQGVGCNYTTSESSNILINNPGVVGESNVLRIGVTGSGTTEINKSFIAGIFGVTVGVSGVPVVIDNAGQLGTVVSSKRFKKDIQPMREDDSSAIMHLKPVSFRMNDDLPDEQKRFGLIAEEVEDQFPYLVSYDQDNKPFSVKYNDLPIFLLNELKKQHSIVNSLVRRINLLEQTHGGFLNEL